MELSYYDEFIKSRFKDNFSISYIIDYIYRDINSRLKRITKNNGTCFYFSFIKDSKYTKDEVSKYVYKFLVSNKFYKEV